MCIYVLKNEIKCPSKKCPEMVLSRMQSLYLYYLFAALSQLSDRFYIVICLARVHSWIINAAVIDDAILLA